MRKVSLIIKRSFDIVFSGVGIVLLFPIFVIISLIIVITMPGPIFFTQDRLGKNGKMFKIYKFRSMRVDKAAENRHNSDGDDLRITKFGTWLRRYKVDELPQIINVFIGDMSLVGPRPAFPEHLRLYDEYERKRLCMRPGMTGLAQVNGNAEIRWEDRIEYDIQYIENYSILLDIKILLKTIRIVIEGEGKFASVIRDTTESKFIYK